MKTAALLLSVSLLAAGGGQQVADLTTTPDPSATVESVQSTPKAPTIHDVDSVTKSAPCTKTFTDVEPGQTFYESITWMACEGLTNGYFDGSFGKSHEITRGEVASLLYRMSGDTHDAGEDMDFWDVPTTSAHFESVSWMKAQGLSNGYSNGSFGRYKPISRGELAAFLYRFAEADSQFPAPEWAPFTDMTGMQDRFFYKPAAWVKSTGLIGGYSDGSFRADRMVTRGETSKFLYAMDSVLDKEEMPNIEGHLWTKAKAPMFAGDTYGYQNVWNLEAQEELQYLGETSNDMVKVRHLESGVEGWVSASYTTEGRPGTTDREFPNPTTNAQKASNNISKWCWGVPVTTGPGVSGGFATYYRDGYTVYEDITLNMDGVDVNAPVAVAIQYHECAHILQYRAYGYNADALDKAMDRVYPADGPNTFQRGYSYVEGTEHMADCMADVMGATRSAITHTAGYGGDCTDAQYDAARKIIAGQPA